MVTRMKTTVEIPDPVLEEAKTVADREGTTLKALVEEGLRRALADRKRETRRFTLRDATFQGRGTQAGVSEDEWETIRSLVYTGRGA